MIIGKHIYKQTCESICMGFKMVIISRNRRSYKGYKAKGKNFELISLKDIKNAYENGIFEIEGGRLGEDEVIDLNENREVIKYKQLKTMKFGSESLLLDLIAEKEMNKIILLRKSIDDIIPSLLPYTDDLRLALKYGYWFHDKSGRGVEYIFMSEKIPGIVTYNNKVFKYKNKNVILTSKKREDLICMIKEKGEI